MAPIGKITKQLQYDSSDITLYRSPAYLSRLELGIVDMIMVVEWIFAILVIHQAIRYEGIDMRSILSFSLVTMILLSAFHNVAILIPRTNRYIWYPRYEQWLDNIEIPFESRKKFLWISSRIVVTFLASLLIIGTLWLLISMSSDYSGVLVYGFTNDALSQSYCGVLLYIAFALVIFLHIQQVTPMIWVLSLRLSNIKDSSNVIFRQEEAKEAGGK
ncbi:hypothetical protein PFISCL1PPCAC_11874 [Pristionchus fissidentatus]|uniref:G protein-coupled receptor n=1 Tax=Pristionchus fissidentatus TaxID=1538716 RepID=A0AAV5VRC1_9BILA|nr:hypothetical protein PFISCL1PPCAC_11874 [Pristionchus fissidentatus]